MMALTDWLGRISGPTETRPGWLRWVAAILLALVVAPIAAPIGWVFVIAALPDPMAVTILFFSYAMGGVPAAIGVAALVGLTVLLLSRGRRCRMGPLLALAAATGVLAPVPFALLVGIGEGDIEAFLGFGAFLAANGLVAGPVAAWVFQRVLWGGSARSSA